MISSTLEPNKFKWSSKIISGLVPMYMLNSFPLVTKEDESKGKNGHCKVSDLEKTRLPVFTIFREVSSTINSKFEHYLW